MMQICMLEIYDPREKLPELDSIYNSTEVLIAADDGTVGEYKNASRRMRPAIFAMPAFYECEDIDFEDPILGVWAWAYMPEAVRPSGKKSMFGQNNRHGPLRTSGPKADIDMSGVDYPPAVEWYRKSVESRDLCEQVKPAAQKEFGRGGQLPESEPDASLSRNQVLNMIQDIDECLKSATGRGLDGLRGRDFKREEIKQLLEKMNRLIDDTFQG